MPYCLRTKKVSEPELVNSNHTALLDVGIPQSSAEVFDFTESNPVEIGVLIADIKRYDKIACRQRYLDY